MLHRIIIILILSVSCLSAYAQSPATTGQNMDWFGAWWRGGPDAQDMKERYPFIKGVFVAMNWAEVEPQPGEFDWQYFEKEFIRYADAGLYIQFMIWTGGHAPRWLFDNGVPEVETTPTINPRGVPHGWTYPHYMDPDYQRFYWRMIRQVAEHIDQLPRRVKERIICLQTAEGTTGDEGPYKGTPLNPAYAFEEDEWNAFKFKTWLMFDELYRPKQPRIYLLINSGNRGQYHDWIMEQLPDTWRKAGNPGHGYQLNAETRMMEFLDPIINQPNRNGEFIRCRSEMDELHKGWFAEAPVWNQYWLNLWGLHFGIDILQHQTKAFEDPRSHEGFIFYNSYGGHKDPAKSPGAWCALRDGLDAADYERFPVKTFGTGELNPRAKDQSQGIRRTLNIIEKFAACGAKQGDPEKAMEMVMQNRSASAMNDVGWEIWAGNYSRYLTQYDPNGTSRGYWRVGSQGQPYGRFARGFDVESGCNTMFFDVHDAFWHQGRGTRTGSMKVRIVYFDSGSGTWELRYDAKNNNAETALSVRNTNSGQWKTITADLPDAWFGNRCPNSTDVMLVNTSPENTLFHMIEITKDSL